MERLTRRAEFKAVAGGRKVSRPGFLLQAARPQGREAEAPARFGFTVTRKIGNAVVRNRIRRRLREAVRLSGADAAKSGMDYVIVGRQAALTLPFDRLITDLVTGIAQISGNGKAEDRTRHG